MPDAISCWTGVPVKRRVSPVLTWMREFRRLAVPGTAASTLRSGLIEIVLPGGISARVDVQVDDGALRRVLAALRWPCRPACACGWRAVGPTFARDCPEDSATLQRILRTPLAVIERLRRLIAGLQRNRFNRLLADADNAPQLGFCWAHLRCKFYDIHVATQSPLAGEALRRIAALYEIEAAIRAKHVDNRRSVRQMHSRPLVAHQVDATAWAHLRSFYAGPGDPVGLKPLEQADPVSRRSILPPEDHTSREPSNRRRVQRLPRRRGTGYRSYSTNRGAALGAKTAARHGPPAREAGCSKSVRHPRYRR